MFASVLKKGDVPRSRFGAGVVISIAVHVALVALVVWFSNHKPAEEEVEPEVKFFAAAPPPPPPPPPPPAGGAQQQPKTEKKIEKKTPKKDVIVQPKEIPVEKPPEAEPQKEEPAAPEPGGVQGGVEGGVEGGVVGGVIGGTVGGVIGGTIGGTGTDVVPFGEGMTRPDCDKGELTRRAYSREALEARVEGKLIIKCQFMADGSVKNCRVIKPLPHVGEQMLKLLSEAKCKPGTFQGKPISIDMTQPFDFKLAH
ncbi:MAG: energy transducer TonB [Archangium gephyra]|uniref:Energy transducer TonB n=1 Tax=Archangium gephyra TaxID=48 RepID=A0A2W5TP07_9BACT|nr:MAG: energy transducer TonB [Archangium gephyra]